MRTTAGLWLLGLCVLVCSLSCGGESARVCIPGQSVACTGPGGCAGGQIRNGTGSAFEVCQCGGAPATDAGAMSDAGGATPGGDDAGQSDAGSTPADGGLPADGGGTLPDGGVAADGGSMSPDGGISAD